MRNVNWEKHRNYRCISFTLGFHHNNNINRKKATTNSLRSFICNLLIFCFL